MKIVITGASGFIGSHMVEECIKQGYQVRALIHYNSRNSWGWLEHLEFKDELEVVAGDIRDADSVFKLMRGCKKIIHMAALIGIPYSYISPLAYIKTNVEGTYNVLQAAKELNYENILITSTSETYGTAQSIPIDEKHPSVAQSPYAASKISADQLASSYFRCFELPLKIVRPFNTYGPRQSARAIIPSIIAPILLGQKKINLGNLLPTRDFTFVKDTVRAFLEVLHCDELVGETVNVGMNQEISILQLGQLISKIMGKKIEITEEERRTRPAASEVQRLRCNNSKLTSYTNWQPAYNLKNGLLETILWMRENLHYYKPGIYNV
jgi:NAD dependent epimerase/dehydratase